ncbi:MAG: NAD(P)/FAD-dependent oxidoreductase, partial [Deltaproteobacteria bacterium]|nr:NAD(P)/FAD-dependent oxidoreductase [Deltaproteobacteria bacterium]
MRPDYLIVGSGLSALAFGALMARAGKRVTVLEAHSAPGGYGHTFSFGHAPDVYRFNARGRGHLRAPRQQWLRSHAHARLCAGYPKRLGYVGLPPRHFVSAARRSLPRLLGRGTAGGARTRLSPSDAPHAADDPTAPSLAPGRAAPQRHTPGRVRRFRSPARSADSARAAVAGLPVATEQALFLRLGGTVHRLHGRRLLPDPPLRACDRDPGRDHSRARRRGAAEATSDRILTGWGSGQRGDSRGGRRRRRRHRTGPRAPRGRGRSEHGSTTRGRDGGPRAILEPRPRSAPVRVLAFKLHGLLRGRGPRPARPRFRSVESVPYRRAQSERRLRSNARARGLLQTELRGHRADPAHRGPVRLSGREADHRVSHRGQLRALQEPPLLESEAVQPREAHHLRRDP